MWQKVDDRVTPDWEHALTLAEDLTLAGYRNSRLPNAEELKSTVTHKRENLAIDPALAGTDSPSWSWMRGTDDHRRYAWYVAFGRAPNAHGIMDKHGAGTMRNNPIGKDPPYGGQGEIRTRDFARCTRFR